MRKHFIMLLLLLVTIFSGCGTEPEEGLQELVYTVENVQIPNPDDSITEQYSYLHEEDYRLAEETLYRLVTIIPKGDDKVQWKLQSLTAPYEMWNTVQLDFSGLTPYLETEEHTYYILGQGLTEQGEVYVTYGDGEGTESVAVLEDGSWISYDSLPAAEEQDNLFSTDTQGVYKKKSGESVLLLKWDAYGYRFQNPPMLWAESEDTFLIFGKIGNHRSLLRAEKKIAGQQTEKQKITLAAYTSSALQNAVAEFNRRSDNYEVVMIDCSKGTNSELTQRFQTELMAGKGPDLLDSLFIELYPYAQNGYLEPLDELLSGNDLLPQAVASGKVEEHCYVAPYRFSLQTLITSKEIVGERTRWTLDEMLQIMEDRSAEAFCMGGDGFTVLLCMLCYDEENADFIDWSSKACHFETQEFVSLLETAKKWADHQNAIASFDFGEEIRDGHVMVIRSIRGAGSTLEDHYRNLDQLGTSCTYIGYPVENGNGTFLEGFGFAVNRSSQCKEGAKAFLNYLMGTEFQLQRWEKEGVLPVNRKLLEKVVNEAALEQSAEGKNTSGDYRTYDASEIEAFYQLILNSKPQGKRYDELVDIFQEETTAYFEGDRDPWEVARILQNRVQLYLDEK